MVRLRLNKIGGILKCFGQLSEEDFEELPPRELPLKKWAAHSQGDSYRFKDLHIRTSIYDRFQQVFFDQSSATIEEVKTLWRDFHTITSSSTPPHWEPVTTPRFRNLLAISEDQRPALEFPFLTTRSLLETFVVESLQDLVETLPFAGLVKELQRPYLEWRTSIRLLANQLAGRPITQDLLLLAIDLALMTPCDGVMSSVVAEPLWEDIFPPIRFRRIVEALAKEKVTLDRPEDYTECVERLCNLFGWPTPSRILNVLGKVDFVFEEGKNLDSKSITLGNPNVVHLNGFQLQVARLFRQAAAVRTAYPSFISSIFIKKEQKPSWDVFYSEVKPVFEIIGGNITLGTIPGGEQTKRALYYFLYLELAQFLWEGLSLDECRNYFLQISETPEVARQLFELFAEPLYPVKWEDVDSLHIGGMPNAGMSNEPETAAPTSAKHLPRRHSVGDRRRRAEELHRRGVIEYQRFYSDMDGDVGREAMRCYQESLAIYKEIGDESGIADNLGQMALIHHLRQEYFDAERLYIECMFLREKLGEIYGARNGWANLATLYDTLGLLDRAKWCRFESERLRMLQWRDASYQSVFAVYLRALDRVQFGKREPICCPLCNEQVVLPLFLSAVRVTNERFSRQLDAHTQKYEIRCQACGAWLGQERLCGKCRTIVINTWDSSVSDLERCRVCGEHLPEVDASLPALTLRAYEAAGTRGVPRSPQRHVTAVNYSSHKGRAYDTRTLCL